MIDTFISKVKIQGLFIVPILVLIIGLLIPPVHWLLAVGISMVFFLIKAVKLPKLKISNSKMEISYPFMPLKSNSSYDLGALKRLVYVDRKKAIRGSYPHSHLNIYKKGNETQVVRIILDKSELDKLEEILRSKEVDFHYTTKMQVKTI